MGADWFEYLLEQAVVEFRIRARESDKLDDGRKALKAKIVFSHLQIDQQQVLLRRRQVWGIGCTLLLYDWQMANC